MPQRLIRPLYDVETGRVVDSTILDRFLDEEALNCRMTCAGRGTRHHIDMMPNSDIAQNILAFQELENCVQVIPI